MKVHVMEKKRYLHKFNPKTLNGYLVGFTARTNTYSVYVPEPKDVAETCNVVFRSHQSKQTNIDAATKQTETA